MSSATAPAVPFTVPSPPYQHGEVVYDVCKPLIPQIVCGCVYCPHRHDLGGTWIVHIIAESDAAYGLMPTIGRVDDLSREPWPVGGAE